MGFPPRQAQYAERRTAPVHPVDVPASLDLDINECGTANENPESKIPDGRYVPAPPPDVEKEPGDPVPPRKRLKTPHTFPGRTRPVPRTTPTSLTDFTPIPRANTTPSTSTHTFFPKHST